MFPRSRAAGTRDDAAAAVYRIRVRGRLDPVWEANAPGCTLRVGQEPDGSVFSELCGPMQDQAELMGLLDQLYAAGALLLELRRMRALGAEGEP